MIYFKKVAKKSKYHDDKAIPDLVAYISRPEKTPSKLIYGVKVDMDNIADSMIEISDKFKKNSRLRLHHFIVSFGSEYETELELIDTVMKEICDEIGRTYQIAAAVHEDTDHPHVHFVFNAVSHVNGYKYRGGKQEYRELIECVRDILSDHDLYPLIAVKYRDDKNNPHE